MTPAWTCLLMGEGMEMWKLVILAAMFVIAFGTSGGRMSGSSPTVQAQEENASAWRVVSVGRMGLQVWKGSDQMFGLNVEVHPPRGLRTMPDALPTVEQGGIRIYEEDLAFYRARTRASGPLILRCTTRQVDLRVVRLHVKCESREALELEGVRISIPDLDGMHHLQGGRLVVTMADGDKAELSIPHEKNWENLGDAVWSIRLEAVRGQDAVELEFSNPATVHYQGHNLHIWALRRSLPAGEPREFEVDVRFPGLVEFEPANRIVDMSDWFPYEGTQDFSPGSAIGMEDWLDRPAGVHGSVRINGNRFAFSDGTPVKFWGTNISWADMARPEDEVVAYAEKFAKHGVNIVRMHKFLHEHTGLDGWPFDASSRWDGIMDKDDPMEFHATTMQRFDHMHAELKKRGIYSGWSPIAFFAFHEGYRDRLTDYDELKAVRDSNFFWVHGNNTLYPFSTFAPDVQDLYIELITKLLNHVNPHTGLRYADDPSLAFVEFRNEAGVFFWGVDKLAAASPVYKKQISEKFCSWLRERYATGDALVKAWAEVGLQEGESLDAGTIFPFPGWGRINELPRSLRLLDSYRFLFDYQDEGYQRFVRAVRATGYEGPLVGSCWQAADWLGYLYNLANDRRVGIIDRHGYHRGLLVGHPGTGPLASGRNAVGDRPFALSEWAGSHVYAAEVSPLVAFVGIGLQGWDASMQYGSNWWGIATHARTGIHSTSEAFHHIGQWPFISRILLSGALQEGEVVARRRISMHDLYPLDEEPAEGFEPLGGKRWDELERTIPPEALAVGRVEIEFVDEPAEQKFWMADLGRYWDREKSIIRASNGQILWDYSGRGFFTVDTPGGQAVVGFGGGRRHILGGVELSYDVPFANVYLVPRRPGETLVNAGSLLLMVLGRTADRGDVLEETTITPLKTTEAPHPGGGRAGAIRHWTENPTLLFEPVNLTVTLKRDAPCRVYVLDHDGRRTADAVEIPVRRTPDGMQFTVDGAKYRTMYYLLEVVER